MSRARGWIRLGLGLLVAGVFAYLAFGRLDGAELWRALRSGTPGALLLGVGFLVASFAVRILRWTVMLRRTAPQMTARACAGPFLAGFAANNLLPLRAGDVIRATAFRTELQSSTMQVLATLVVERVLDLLALLVFLFLGFLFVPAGGVPAELMRGAAALFAIGGVALLLLLALPRFFRGLFDRVTALLRIREIGLVRRLRGWLGQFVDSLVLIRGPGTLARLVGLSLLAWGLEGGVFACVALSLGSEWWSIAPWFAMAAATIATLLPSTPGHVGTFDYFAIVGLTAFGAAQEVAAAVAILSHVIIWLPVTVAGGAYLLGNWGTAALRQARPVGPAEPEREAS